MTKKRTFSLERISQYSILLLTFLTVFLTAMGVYYTMRSFQKVPLHVVVLGVVEGEILQGIRTLNLSISGASLRECSLQIKGPGGESVASVSDCETGLPLRLDTAALADAEYRLDVEVRHGRRVVFTEQTTFRVDNTGPTINFHGISEGEVVGGVLQLGCSSVDEQIHYEMILDETVLIPPGAFSTTRLADGHHSLRVHATDEIGNTTERVVWFVVDNTEPVITSLGVPDAGLVCAGAVLDPDVTEINPDRNEWFVSGNPDPLQVEASLDVSLLPEGEQLIILRAVDQAGNTTEKQAKILVDKTPPQVDLSIPAGKVPIHENGVVLLSAFSPEITRCDYVVNGKPHEGVLLFLSRLGTGQPIFVEISCADLAGNTFVQTSSLVPGEGLPELLGYAQNVTRSTRIALRKALKFGEELLSALGCGVSVWPSGPPWDVSASFCPHVSIGGRYDVLLSRNPPAIRGIRFPVASLGTIEYWQEMLRPQVIAEFGGYSCIRASTPRAFDPEPRLLEVRDEYVVSSSWAKLSLALSSPLIPLRRKDGQVRFIDEDVRLGIGYHELHTTTRIAKDYAVTLFEHNWFSVTTTETIYEQVVHTRHGGLFLVFEFSLNLGPIGKHLPELLRSP